MDLEKTVSGISAALSWVLARIGLDVGVDEDRLVTKRTLLTKETSKRVANQS